jgi:hypothetical protein
MEGTLGLRPPPTALQGLRLIVLSQVRRDSGPAWEEIASTWESSLAVLCVHNRAELVSSGWFVQCVHCTLYSVYTV